MAEIIKIAKEINMGKTRDFKGYIKNSSYTAALTWNVGLQVSSKISPTRISVKILENIPAYDTVWRQDLIIDKLISVLPCRNITMGSWCSVLTPLPLSFYIADLMATGKRNFGYVNNWTFPTCQATDYRSIPSRSSSHNGSFVMVPV